MDFWHWVARHFAPSEHNEYKPHLLRRSWLVLFLCVTLAAEGFLVADLVARQQSQSFLAAVVPAEIIALTNTERAHNNADALSENAQLDAAAQAKAADMAAQGYFAHVGPGGKTPWQWIAEAGYQYQYAGENLAVRFVDSQDVINAWMASPTHRANIVKLVYTQIGIGVAQGVYEGQPATYVVQYFGTPLAAAEQVSSVPAASAPARPAASGMVEGASIAVPVSSPAATAHDWTQSLERQILRAFSEPLSTTNAVLGGVFLLIVAALVLAFFMHIQIQHPRMLMSGIAVAGVAAFLIMLNGLVGGAEASQAASAALALPSAPGIVIDTEAAAVGFALFPR
jgi:hypothetical protein